MIIPDLVEPIIAYRSWLWDGTFLKSYNGVPWRTMQPMKAECRAMIVNGLTNESFDPEHGPAPGKGCSCGVYAARDIDHLRDLGYLAPGTIHGEISLWGRVWEHDMGYRAEFAYPKSLVMDPSRSPRFLKTVGTNLVLDFDGTLASIEALAGYNTDLWISPGPRREPVLLFRKNEGAREDIQRFLLQDAAGWYSSQLPTPPLAPGDRVAVSGYGFGIVKQITEPTPNLHGWVIMLIMNRELMTARLDGVRWSKTNRRWEYSPGPNTPLYGRGLRSVPAPSPPWPLDSTP